MEDKKKLENELWAACRLLPAETMESKEGYDSHYFLACMKKSEYVCAMEELEGVIGDNQSPGKAFWLHLITAAELLNHPHVTRYESILRLTS